MHVQTCHSLLLAVDRLHLWLSPTEKDLVQKCAEKTVATKNRLRVELRTEPTAEEEAMLVLACCDCSRSIFMHRRIHTYYHAYARYVASVALLSFLHLSLHEHLPRVVGHSSSPCSLALVPYAFSMLPSGVPTFLTMPDVMLLAIPCYLVSSSLCYDTICILQSPLFVCCGMVVIAVS